MAKHTPKPVEEYSKDMLTIQTLVGKIRNPETKHALINLKMILHAWYERELKET